MAFELKDLLTPVASLLAVWLTARFTLNREIRKKELELRVDRLEKLSADCDEVLLQLINYADFISGLVQSRLLLLTPTQSKTLIPIQAFSEDKDLLDNSKLAPDREKGRRCETAYASIIIRNGKNGMLLSRSCKTIFMIFSSLHLLVRLLKI